MNFVCYFYTSEKFFEKSIDNAGKRGIIWVIKIYLE